MLPMYRAAHTIEGCAGDSWSEKKKKKRLPVSLEIMSRIDFIKINNHVEYD